MSLINRAQLRALSLFAIACALAFTMTPISANAQNRAEFCNEYADNAVEQQEANDERECGYSGPRWSSNRTRHFAWCMIFPKQARAEQNARRKELRECRREARRENRRERRRETKGKRASCDTYAKTAVVQAQANRKYKCGFRGGEWIARERTHFRWCMRSRRAYLADETRYRLAQLQKCFNKLGDYDDEENDRGYRRRRFR